LYAIFQEAARALGEFAPEVKKAIDLLLTPRPKAQL
jgi:hypothetical protein